MKDKKSKWEKLFDKAEMVYRCSCGKCQTKAFCDRGLNNGEKSILVMYYVPGDTNTFLNFF